MVVATQPVEILTANEVAELLKVEPRTIYSMTRSRCKRPLPSFRVGKSIRFVRSDIVMWLQQARQGKAA